MLAAELRTTPTPFSAHASQNSRDSNSSFKTSEIWRMGVDDYQHCSILAVNMVRINELVAFGVSKKPMSQYVG